MWRPARPCRHRRVVCLERGQQLADEVPQPRDGSPGATVCTRSTWLNSRSNAATTSSQDTGCRAPDDEGLPFGAPVLERNDGERGDVLLCNERVSALSLTDEADGLSRQGRTADDHREPGVHERIRTEHGPRHSALAQLFLGLRLGAHEVRWRVGRCAANYVNETPAHPHRGFHGRDRVHRKLDADPPFRIYAAPSPGRLSKPTRCGRSGR